MTNNVSNQELYNAINDLRKEVMARTDKIEIKVVEIDNWRNKVIGQFSVLMVLIGASINYIWDSIFRK